MACVQTPETNLCEAETLEISTNVMGECKKTTALHKTLTIRDILSLLTNFTSPAWCPYSGYSCADSELLHTGVPLNAFGPIYCGRPL